MAIQTTNETTKEQLQQRNQLRRVFVYHSDFFDFLCFRIDALTELGAFMRIEFLCISVL